MKNSKLFEQIYQLRERDYHFNLDPSDRSWFIGPGVFWADVSHRLILKREFPEEWKKLVQKGMSDGDIESVFTDRLLKQGYIKIGELNNFYAECKEPLDQREKDILQGWCESWLKVSPESGYRIITINNTRYIIKEIASDVLMKDGN